MATIHANVENELELFDQTVDAIKNLKVFMHQFDFLSGETTLFGITTDTTLLHPFFYVYEVLCGEEIGGIFCFDKFSQVFYEKGTNEEYSIEELIKSIRTDMVYFATGEEESTEF